MHDGRPLEVHDALDVTARVLSALEYSHRAGIVHRDIKPANVMMTPNGDIKVMDFGIARAMADSSSTMTQTHSVIGTAQYLSPEQARGETVDARSDLYSAGCLLYELLTGRPPFVADSPVAVAYQHVREEPQPPSAFNPAVPEVADRITLHALAKDRETRYQSAGEFRADLEAALAGRPVTAVAAGQGGATTQFLGAPGAGTRMMQPVAGPTVPVGGGMLPGSPGEPDYGYEPRRDQREAERGGKGAGYVLLGLAILIVAGLVAFTVVKLGSGGTPQPTKVAVTDVTGLPLKQALSLLRSAGFTNIDSKQQKSDPKVPAGEVLSQDPTGQTLALKTDPIILVISKGSDSVQLPDLTGKSKADAQKILQDAGLRVDFQVPQDVKDKQKDQVVSTDPAAGPVPKGSIVKVVLATGTMLLPDLRNSQLTDATTQLNKLGFNIRLRYQDAQPGSGGEPRDRPEPRPGRGQGRERGDADRDQARRAAEPHPDADPQPDRLANRLTGAADDLGGDRGVIGARAEPAPRSGPGPRRRRRPRASWPTSGGRPRSAPTPGGTAHRRAAARGAAAPSPRPSRSARSLPARRARCRRSPSASGNASR